MPLLYNRAMTDLNSCPNSSVKCNTAPGDNNPPQPLQTNIERQPEGAYIGLAIVLVLMLLGFIGWMGFGGGSRRFARFWARFRGRRTADVPKDVATPAPNPDKESAGEDGLGRVSSESTKKTESSSVNTLGDRLPSIPEEPTSPSPGRT
ncbi:hypothetical protein M407DRAFT_242867 [Tulasnella calospora MUT 4182]|uniref:Uncharacterized protein n=1 Tax=Tulasnella calospora MUT 4182 TaxID=1051891 RepID=A0A0C3QNS2_9AGAM|nr:hypothetical protein M407DRAFT_242867 [Tulasnella calospora MUT 4182]